MLPLPAFLLERQLAGGPAPDDLRQAYDLSGYFLLKNVYQPRGMPMPEIRSGFLKALRRCLSDGDQTEAPA